jgi:membrane fusion protein (multidrug efflux system)
MSASILVKRWIFVIIPLIIVGIAGSVILFGILRPSPQQAPFVQSVVLHELTKASAVSTLKTLGLVEANKRVELLARVSGFLLEKTFEEGDQVKRGQVLFQIEPDQYKASLSAAEADVSSAQAQLERSALEYNRLKDLYEKRSSPKADFDNAAAAWDVAKASLQAAQARLEQATLNFQYTSVKAPFDGSISDTPFSEGSLISPESGILATVTAIDPVEVSLGISDTVMGRSRLDDERSGLPGGTIENAVFSISINGQNVYDQKGEVIYVSPEVDRNTDTVKIKVRFPNPKSILAPGQSVVVNITPKDPRQVLLLPKGALMTSEGQSFVYLTAPAPAGQGGGESEQAGLVAELRTITVGDEFEDGFEVLSGLKEGEKIIILGLMSAGARLRPGAPVMIVQDPAEGGTPAESGEEGFSGAEAGGE